MPRNFAINANITKRADMRLPNDTGKWKDKIYKRLLRMHPYLTERLQGGIDWSVEPVDKNSGNAIGIVTALAGEQPIRIPIVVRDHELKPIDMYLRPDGEMDVLDESVVMEDPVPQSADVGRKVNPHNGGRLYNGGNGIRGQILSKVSSYNRYAEDCDRMRQHVVENHPKLADSFDRLKKEGEAQGESPRWDTMVVEYDEDPFRGERFKLAGFKQGRQSVDAVVDRHQAFSDSDSDLAKVARSAIESGTVVLSRRELDKTAYVVDATSGGVRQFSPGDRVEVPEEDGMTTGTAYQMVRMSAPYPSGEGAGYAFIGDDCGYMHPISAPATSSSSSGSPLSSAEPLTSAQPREKGFLVIPQKDGPDAVSGPVTVQEWIQNDQGEEQLVVRSRLDGHMYIEQSDVLPKIQQVNRDSEPRGNDRYLVPSDVQFLECADEVRPHDSTGESIKEAKESDDRSTYRLSKNGPGIKVSGPDLSMTLPAKQAEALLQSVGATPPSAQTAVKEAQSRSKRNVRVEGLEPAANTDRVTADAPEEKVAYVLDKWAKARPAINKLAARLPQAMAQAGPAPNRPMMPGRPQQNPRQQPQRQEPVGQQPQGGAEARDSHTLQSPAKEDGEALQDSLNAVNLLNQYNASKFSGSLEEITKAKQVVAELLYRVRTGAIEVIEEDIVKDAMSALDAVTEGLKELKASDSSA